MRPIVYNRARFAKRREKFARMRARKAFLRQHPPELPYEPEWEEPPLKPWQPDAVLVLEIAHSPCDSRMFLARFNGVEKGFLSATKIARLVRKLVTSKR